MSTDPPAGMRRQYHFMPDEDGQKAWDVHRLIRLSADLPVEEVPLAEIDKVYWFDGDHHRPTVRSVVEHMALIDATTFRTRSSSGWTGG